MTILKGFFVFVRVALGVWFGVILTGDSYAICSGDITEITGRAQFILNNPEDQYLF